MSTKDELLALIGEYADSVYHRRTDASEIRVALESAIVEACDSGLTPEQSTASKLIDAWVTTHRRPCPWKTAIEITSIVTHMTDAEKDRLLALDDVPPRATEAAIERDRKDALRYRWLRDSAPHARAVTILNDSPEGIDAAVSLAMLHKETR